MTDMTVRHSTVALPMCGKITVFVYEGRDSKKEHEDERGPGRDAFLDMGPNKWQARPDS